MKKLLVASALLLSMGAVQASESPQWNKLEVSYQQLDDGVDELSGFGIAGTALLDENIFADVSYRSSSDSVNVYGDDYDLEYNVLSAGIGYKHSISQTTDVFGVISYEDIEVAVKYNGFSEDVSGDGYGAKLGVRSMMSKQFELMGSIQYVKIEGENETGLELSALYHLNEEFSLGVAYETIGDLDTTSVKAVYFF